MLGCVSVGVYMFMWGCVCDVVCVCGICVCVCEQVLVWVYVVCDYVCVRVCVWQTQRQREKETEEEETLEGNSKDIPWDSNCPRMKSPLLIMAAGWDELGTQRDADAGVRNVWFHSTASNSSRWAIL